MKKTRQIIPTKNFFSAIAQLLGSREVLLRRLYKIKPKR